MSEAKLARAPERGLTLDMVCEMTGYAPTEVALISRTVAVGAPLQELAVFLHACRTLHLDPLLRQAYWIRRGQGPAARGTLQVGIDGFRAIADASGAYAGSEPPTYRGQVKLKDKTAPEKASVAVWKIVQGHKSAFTGEAYWAEFYPGDGPEGAMWRKMPHRMLSKTAEAEALRKGFPAQLSAVAMDAVAGEDTLTVEEAPRRVVTAADYDHVFAQDEPPAAAEAAAAQPAEQPELDAHEAGISAVEMDASTTAQQALSNQWQRNRALVADAGMLKLRAPTMRSTATIDQLVAANEDLARRIREASP